MAHIIEEFHRSCGLSHAGEHKPELAEHFFPITFDKYLILSCSSKEQTMFYPYWEEVHKLIKLYLEIEGIHIVQIIQGDYPVIQGADLTLGTLTNQQLAYVVKNSIGVACSSGLVSHMASAYGIKTVSLHSKYFIKNTKPFWTEENICLEPTRDVKPTFSNKDPKHRIKSIKPEDIASGILNILGINQDITHESIFYGEHYPNQVGEVCPNFFNNSLTSPNQPLNIRLDWHFDLQLAAQWCQTRKVNIFSDKDLDINFIKSLKQNINRINIFITEQTSVNYIKNIEKTGVKFNLYTKDQENISKIRLKFIDWIVDEYLTLSKKDVDNHEKICDNSHYKSSKIILSNNQVYSSQASMLNNKPKGDQAEKVIDCPEFWEDLPHLYIFNK